MKSTKAVLAVFMLAFVALSGCAEPEPDPPPVLVVEKLRHWFEGDEVVIDLLIRNQANITSGVGTFPLEVDVILFHEETVTTEGDRGRETTRPESGNPRDEFDLPSLEPGESIQVEFTLPTREHYEGDDGYYYIYVDMPSFYPAPDPQSTQIVAWYEFVSGCFNHDVSEFYGIQDPGVDCFIWDCTGEWTENGYPFRDIKLSARPDCSATDATGPQYAAPS